MTPYGILIDIMVPRFARESVGLRYVLMTFCDGTFNRTKAWHPPGFPTNLSQSFIHWTW
jgi:hypothetical protein